MVKFSSTYRPIALLLAFLMFITSAGFAVDTHYCQGKLESVNFLMKAKSCHEMREATPLEICRHGLQKYEKEQKKDRSLNKKDCCQNKTAHIQLEQDQHVQAFDFNVSKQAQQFVIAYVAVFLTYDLSFEDSAASFSHYEPPLLSRDIPVLIQSFLI